MLRVACLLFSLISITAFAKDRFLLSSELGAVEASENGSFSSLEAEYLEYQNFSLGMHYQSDTRIFLEDEKVLDSRVGIQGSTKLPGTWNYRWRFSLGQQENIFATFSLSNEFRWRWKDFNIQLGLNHYEYEILGSIQEGSVGTDYRINKKIKVGGKLNVSNTTPTANNFEFSGQYRLKQWELEAEYDVGKVVEADGVVADRNSYDFKAYYNFKVNKSYLKIAPAYQYYDGTVRDEQRFYFSFIGAF
tara:strand:- start:164 stop:904 length:741 start_codon:yes stop_codon:yes gene_type:complete